MHLSPRLRLAQLKSRHQDVDPRRLGSPQEYVEDLRVTTQYEPGPASHDHRVAAGRDFADHLLRQVGNFLPRVEEWVRIRRRPAGSHTGLERREGPDEPFEKRPGSFSLGFDLARLEGQPGGDLVDELLVDDLGAKLGGDYGRNGRSTGAELA